MTEIASVSAVLLVIADYRPFRIVPGAAVGRRIVVTVGAGGQRVARAGIVDVCIASGSCGQVAAVRIVASGIDGCPTVNFNGRVPIVIPVGTVPTCSGCISTAVEGKFDGCKILGVCLTGDVEEDPIGAADSSAFGRVGDAKGRRVGVGAGNGVIDYNPHVIDPGFLTGSKGRCCDINFQRVNLSVSCYTTQNERMVCKRWLIT